MSTDPYFDNLAKKLDAIRLIKSKKDLKKFFDMESKKEMKGSKIYKTKEDAKKVAQKKELSTKSVDELDLDEITTKIANFIIES